MKSRTLSSSHLLQAVAFLVVLGLGLYAIDVGRNLHDRNLNLRQQQLLPIIATQIETALTHSLAATYTLEQEVKRGNGSFAGFNSYAAKMTSSFPEVTSFQLAPLGRVTEKYPPSTNHIAIGTDVLTNWRSAGAARAALEHAELVLTTPFAINGDDKAVVAWNPVYLSDKGTDRFWGYTSVTISIKDLIADTDIPKLLEMNATHEIAWVDSESGAETVLYSFGDWAEADYYSTPINLPHDSQWVLRIANCSTIKQWQLMIGYLLCVLVAWMAAAYFRSADALRHRLSLLVEKKTSELNHIAYHDNLTGLPNHRHFCNLLDTELANNHDAGYGPHVLLIDLDLFSEVNDAFGQHGGDALLVEAANRIRRCLPEPATLARWGDDEFIVMLSDVPNDKVVTIVALISRALSVPCIINGSDTTVSACIGVAAVGNEVACANDVLSWVEQALNSAKASGRNETSWFSEEMRHKCRRRQMLIADLRNAIGRQELELYYQPIVSGSSGRTRKAECLLRWNHPTLNMVSPFEFIPLAEETGLIRDIGDWVFEQAVLQVKSWRERYDPEFCISVNVSPVQLNRPGTVKQWLKLLMKHNVPSDAILIEITEGILLDKNTAAYAQIEVLRKAGVPLALDDFGTGYSSMSYLKVFQIDYIKIDRSFVSNLTESREDMILCDAIIAIADKMNIKVVAEGVETIEQHRLLTAAGSDYSQGYYFSRPVPAVEFAGKFLRREEELVA